MGRYSIGELAGLTGLTVKTVRFYSDRGIVAPADRNAAGHRRYDEAALARLRLVCTLRQLGLDLATIRTVLDRPAALPDVAAEHAAALAVQIRVLRLRQAVLTLLAERGADPEEMSLVHTLATLSEQERRRLVEEFLDGVFADVDTGPDAGPDAGAALPGLRRTMTPELPDDPDPEQIEAWVRIAELTQDPDFRATMRSLVRQHATDQGPDVRKDVVAVARDEATAALAAGIDPTSPAAAPVLDAIATRYASLVGRPDDTALRQRLLTRLETAGDARRQRYVELLSAVNGWAAADDLTAPLAWSTRALRARLTA